MQISSRFTLGVHILLFIIAAEGKRKATSELLGKSTSAHPVMIRKLLGNLKEAGLIQVASGTGGAKLAKQPEEITLLDVYRAVEVTEADNLFRFHDCHASLCPVAKNIHFVLDRHLSEAQKRLEDYLQTIALSDLGEEMKSRILEGGYALD